MKYKKTDHHVKIIALKAPVHHYACRQSFELKMTGGSNACSLPDLVLGEVQLVVHQTKRHDFWWWSCFSSSSSSFWWCSLFSCMINTAPNSKHNKASMGQLCDASPDAPPPSDLMAWFFTFLTEKGALTNSPHQNDTSESVWGRERRGENKQDSRGVKWMLALLRLLC